MCDTHNATWVSSPEFLIQPESAWSVNPEDVHQLPADDPEVKKTVVVKAVQAAEEVDVVTHHQVLLILDWFEKSCCLNLESKEMAHD